MSVVRGSANQRYWSGATTPPPAEYEPSSTSETLSQLLMLLGARIAAVTGAHASTTSVSRRSHGAPAWVVTSMCSKAQYRRRGGKTYPREKSRQGPLYRAGRRTSGRMATRIPGCALVPEGRYTVTVVSVVHRHCGSTRLEPRITDSTSGAIKGAHRPSSSMPARSVGWPSNINVRVSRSEPNHASRSSGACN